LKFIYADPPYIGQAKKHYDREEVCHATLIKQLCAEGDAWALSCSSPTLQEILPMCPIKPKPRIGAWIKPFCAFKKNVNPAYAWEPVIFWNARKRTRHQDTERDWIAESITLRKGLSGAKPLPFCFWLFDFANLTPEDEFVDLFPGTGIVTEAWEMWKKRFPVSPAEQPQSTVMAGQGPVMRQTTAEETCR